jgi:hypothetical protein
MRLGAGDDAGPDPADVWPNPRLATWVGPKSSSQIPASTTKCEILDVFHAENEKLQK